MEEIEYKKRIQELEAENARLKKALTEAPSARPNDPYVVVQTVQGLLNGYLSLREEKGKLQLELQTRNEDNRRLQKILAGKEEKK